MMNMNIVGLQQLQTRYTQKMNTGSGLCASINNKVSLPIFRQLKGTVPVFTGNLLRNMNMQVLNGSNKSTTWIRFPTMDPIRGHPYIWYAEYGRPAISGKTNPKMRYWTTPGMAMKHMHQGYGLKDDSIVFRKNVGASRPTFFIRDSLLMGKMYSYGIAMIEVNRWLAT